MSSEPLRIAVLECDTPVDKVKAELGGYGNIFETLLSSGADLLAKETGTRVPLDIRIFNVVNDEIYPTLNEIDAVLLTGSSESSPVLSLAHRGIERKVWEDIEDKADGWHRVQLVRQFAVDTQAGGVYEEAADGAREGQGYWDMLRASDRGEGVGVEGGSE